MTSQGEDPPREPDGRPDEPEQPEQPEQPDEPAPEGKPDKPAYTVYRAGKGDAEEGERREPPEKAKKATPAGEKPDYRVYRSRPSLRDRAGKKPDLASIRSGGGGGLRQRLSGAGGSGWRRWLRWALIAIAAWLLVSFISFAVSAQKQKGKLDDSAKEALKGGPDLLAGQNILILGGDRRGNRQGNANGSEGQGPPRADTIMVLHASLTSFKKLSIPRDTYADIPGCGQQKINASLACNTNSLDGNIASTIKTVSNFLGIDIHHVMIIDFDGFADLINTLGGVTVDIPDNKNVTSTCKRRGVVVAGDIDGGKQQGGVSLGLPAGETTLEGDKALALARLRHNSCDPSEDDRDRAARQQLILNAMKGRLTSITRLPYNFVKGPWIGWNMPKAFISDMGGFTLPQIGIAALFGGNGETNVLGRTPDGDITATSGPGGSISIPQSECRKAVEELTGGDPDREPTCSP
jgi:LCP family protein required for cell wall assembly